MLFPTITFAVFLAVVLPASWLLMHNRVAWRFFMLGASFWFYAAWDWHYVFLLAGSILANQVFARAIHLCADDRGRRRRVAMAVAANLAALAWFKYAGFFGQNTSSALRWFGAHVTPPFANVLLPIGISFFTFQALSYVIDVYRRKLNPVSLLDFAVYLSFFPHLVAGPIVRAGEFLPQLRHRRDPHRVDATLAFWLIAAGLFKKVVIADYLAQRAVDPLFGFPFQHGGVEALVGVYAYAIQIYADFSGYTDIAIGVALLLGFRFPQNFDAPYTATSLQDFWRRWHMTLSRWLRDYVYIPLGGNQQGRRRTYRNLMITMLVGGLWHGAAWTFVIWGGLHGFGLVVERWWGELSQRRRRGPLPGIPEIPPAAGMDPEPPLEQPAVLTDALPPAEAGAPGTTALLTAAPETTTPVAEAASRRVWLRRIVTFHLVCLGWVFFRARSVSAALEILHRIFRGTGTAAIDPVVLAVIAVALAAQYVSRDTVLRAQVWMSQRPVLVQGALLAAVLLCVDVLGPNGVAPFIYFRF